MRERLNHYNPPKNVETPFWLHYRVWGTVQVAVRGNLLFAQRQIGCGVSHFLYVRLGVLTDYLAAQFTRFARFGQNPCYSKSKQKTI